MPDMVAGRISPTNALYLGRAGLSGITRANGKVTIGAATPVVGARGRRRAARHGGRSRRRPRGARPGHRRREHLRRSVRRHPARRPAGGAARARRECPLDGQGRREDRDARGLPRRRRRAARAGRLLRRRPAAERLCGGLAPAHAPLHDPRGRGSLPGRRAPDRRDRRRAEGRPARRRRPAAPGSSCATTRSRRPGTAPAFCPSSSSGPSPTSRRPDEPDRQRHRARRREPRAPAAAPRPPRGARDHQPQGRLPAGRLRDVHGARRRRAPPVVPAPARGGRRRIDHDGRGDRHRGAPRPRPGRVPRALRLAVRLLHAGLPARDARADGTLAERGPRRDRGGARRAHVPLHRVREDPRAVESARAEAPHEGGRRTAPALRRHRARHRAHRVRRRRPRPEHALGEGAPLAGAPRRDHEARHLEGGGDEGRARDCHLGGRAPARLRAPRGARHPRRRAAAREGRGPLQGPADRAGRGRGRGDRTARHGGDRGRVRRAPGAVRHPPGSGPRRTAGAPLGQLVPALRGGDGRPPDPQGRTSTTRSTGPTRSSPASTGRPRSSRSRWRRRSRSSFPSRAAA